MRRDESARTICSINHTLLSSQPEGCNVAPSYIKNVLTILSSPVSLAEVSRTGPTSQSYPVRAHETPHKTIPFGTYLILGQTPPAKIACALYRKHPCFHWIYEVSENSKHNRTRQILSNTTAKSVYEKCRPTLEAHPQQAGCAAQVLGRPMQSLELSDQGQVQ